MIISTPGIFSRTGVLETSLSDHLPIYGVIPRVSCHSQHQVISMRKWREESITAFSENLSHMPWGTLSSAQDINEKVDVWSKFLKSCMDNRFPLRKKKDKKNHTSLAEQLYFKTDAETKPIAWAYPRVWE